MKNVQTAKKDAKYRLELVPRLSRYQPGQWVSIADIANDVEDFISTVQRLCNDRLFDDADGYCIIEIKEEAFVRLDPDYLRRIKPGFRIWK